MSLDNNFLDTLSTCWENYSDEEKNAQVDYLIEQDYYLNSESPAFLKSNKKYILASLEHDLKTTNYISSEMLDDVDIFKFLVLHNYYSSMQIKKFPIGKLLDQEVMHSIFEQTNSYGSEHYLYRERVCKFFYDALQKFPKISTFHQIFDAALLNLS